MTRILIGVPCYNCANQVKRVSEGLKPIVSDFNVDVLYVDNCSTDQTWQQLLEISKRDNQSKSIQNPRNLGLGGSQKVLFQYGLEHSYDALIVLHGDDQASCDDIQTFVHHYKEKPVHYLGSRFTKGSKRMGYQVSRIFGNVALNLLFTLVTRRKISDLGSGLNLFNLKDLREFNFNQLSDHFNFNVELLLTLVSLRQDFYFVPIVWRETDQVSNARNFRVAFSMLRSLWHWLAAGERR